MVEAQKTKERPLLNVSSHFDMTAYAPYISVPMLRPPRPRSSISMDTLGVGEVSSAVSIDPSLKKSCSAAAIGSLAPLVLQ